jgi:hypothetical protein
VSGVDFYNNIVRMYYDDSKTGQNGQHPDMLQLQGPYIRIYNNEFIDTADSAIDFDHFWNGRHEHIRIYNNVFRQIDQSQTNYPWWCRFYGSNVNITVIDDFIFANNTFVDCSKSGGIGTVRFYPQGGTFNPTVTNSIFANNLWYNSGSSTYGVFNSPSAANSTQMDFNFSHNLINAGNHGYTGVTIDGSIYTQSNGVTAAPTFVSYIEKGANNDLHLAEGSAGIGQGIDLSAYFNTDKDGKIRNGAWYLGAFQFNGESQDVSTPKNLKLVTEQP